MRITSKGQVTIPQAIRESTGLMPGTDLDFIVEGTVVRLVKATPGRRPSRGARAVRLLRGRAGQGPLTTDEIMELTRGEG